MAHGRQVLKRIDLVRINNRVISAAATILPTELRTLDAVHLATAQQFRDDLREIVTYDVRMAEAAELLGFRVTAPR